MDQLFRTAAGRIVAILTRQLGPEHLDLIEDAVQDAVLRALETWPFRGQPANPAGWLMQVARNRALDRLREAARHQQKLRGWQEGWNSRSRWNMIRRTPSFACCSSAVILRWRRAAGWHWRSRPWAVSASVKSPGLF